ncbi:hypothetical protein GA0070606_5306 [Micromonospora citrea]|uniref:Uncharacterized protein n=1 Tax=Micromonospora citrea TaxID=47855 RepID=A0A1C6VV91_9ACTN|nr:hypothetical protein [Micromonospora citrea]SCL70142.1 hypothetical protein GA0070606_5306 [Micromonospora citrea]
MGGWVDVYQRDDGRLYVSSHSRVVGGPRVVNGWCEATTADVADGRLGALVRDGLRAGEEPLRDVTADDVREFLRRLLALARVGSVAVFARGARAVGVERHDSGGCVVVATEYRGAGLGFVFTDTTIAVPAEAPADDLGRAVRRGLASSCDPGSRGHRR